MADEQIELEEITQEKKQLQQMTTKMELEKLMQENDETKQQQKMEQREAVQEYFPFTHGDAVNAKRLEEKERTRKEL